MARLRIASQPRLCARWCATHAVAPQIIDRTTPNAPRRRRVCAPHANASATTASSRPVLLVDRLIRRTDPPVSDSTRDAARDAVNRPRDSRATVSGPSSASDRTARISSDASDQRWIRGLTVTRPRVASWNSASRNLSHTIRAGRHTISRSTSADTRGHGDRRRPSTHPTRPVFDRSRPGRDRAFPDRPGTAYRRDASASTLHPADRRGSGPGAPRPAIDAHHGTAAPRWDRTREDALPLVNREQDRVRILRGTIQPVAQETRLEP